MHLPYETVRRISQNSRLYIQYCVTSKFRLNDFAMNLSAENNRCTTVYLETATSVPSRYAEDTSWALTGGYHTMGLINSHYFYRLGQEDVCNAAGSQIFFANNNPKTYNQGLALALAVWDPQYNW